MAGNGGLFSGDIAVRMATQRAVVVVIRTRRQQEMPRDRMGVRRKCICHRQRRGHGIDDKSARANLHCHRAVIYLPCLSLTTLSRDKTFRHQTAADSLLILDYVANKQAGEALKMVCANRRQPWLNPVFTFDS
jgi:hypothetical protein